MSKSDKAPSKYIIYSWHLGTILESKINMQNYKLRLIYQITNNWSLFWIKRDGNRVRLFYLLYTAVILFI